MAGPKKSRPPANSFAGIPRIVMQSDDYKNLSGNSVKLLLALSYQYRGFNNGDLTAAWSVLHDQFGFSSRHTIKRALNELQAAGMIIQTRTPKFMNPGGQCGLYALTWKPIDDCPGKRLEAKPTRTPPRKFSMEQK